jgi:hypothetical protein
MDVSVAGINAKIGEKPLAKDHAQGIIHRGALHPVINGLNLRASPGLYSLSPAKTSGIFDKLQGMNPELFSPAMCVSVHPWTLPSGCILRSILFFYPEELLFATST